VRKKGSKEKRTNETYEERKKEERQKVREKERSKKEGRQKKETGLSKRSDSFSRSQQILSLWGVLLCIGGDCLPGAWKAA
jgi:hypothetical protein